MKCKECEERVYWLDETMLIDNKEHQLRECLCGTVYDEDGNDVTEKYYEN